MEGHLRYRLLGRLEVVADDGRSVPLAAGKEPVLLAALLLAANRAVSTTRLIDVLWGDDPPPTAVNALQAQVSRLRRKLSAASGRTDLLRGERSGYVLAVLPGELDAARFEDLIRVDGTSEGEAASRLRDALALWTGPALADVDSDALAGEAARLDELRMLALERRIEADLALGRHGELVAELEALVREQPLREGFRAQLMLALYRSGRQAEALAAYRDARAVLSEELGIDPGPRLRALELAILNQAAELDGPPTRPHSPSGIVTFVFTDIEGSTRMVQRLGADWDGVLHDHYRILRRVWDDHGGYEVSTEGDGFFVAFVRPERALQAAVEAQRALADHHWPTGVDVKVRIGIHTGEARRHGGDYTGLAVHQAARVKAAAHGGQIIVTDATRSLAGTLCDDISFTDLGNHRLRDIESTVRIYQVTAPGLGTTFPPPLTLTGWPNNFRLELTSFVGRDDDVVKLKGLMDDARLVTLVGAGGVGKTRLALRVATEMLDALQGGAWLVDLAGVSDGNLVADVTASALGFRQQPGRPVLDTLTDALLRRQLLLVLDNCEHLVDACAVVAEHLISACAGLKVLATSREPINIPGEVLWRVRSLTVPGEGCDREALLRAEATALFDERARSADPAFEIADREAEAVAQICRRLDGMPLAIELAASRMKTMSVAELASQLDDRFRLLRGGSRTTLPRQRTLEAAVAWSYELLAPLERLLFDRLSVFSGGCTLAAAQRVCSDHELPDDRILELIGQLVDRSMVVAEKNPDAATRYGMLETLRHYGRDRLLERGESETIRGRHLRWATEVTERGPPATAPSLLDPQILAEEHNLRAALDWALDHNDDEAALRIVSPAWFGHFHDRVPLFERLLPPSPAVPIDVAVQALWAGLALAFMMGEWELGALRGAWGVEAARAAGQAGLLSLCLSYQGMCRWGLGDVEEATRLTEEALRVAESADLAEPHARALLGLANLYTESDLDRAEHHAWRARALVTDAFNTGHIDEVLGIIYFLRGDLGVAAAHLADAVRLFKDIQPNCAAHMLESCAAWAAAAQQYEVGAELIAAAERIRQETADKPRPNERVIRRDWLPRIPAHLDAESFDAALKRGRLRGFSEALDFAEARLIAHDS